MFCLTRNQADALQVLENYHCSKAFELMQTDPSCNILSKFSLDKWKAIRTSIVSMVLATDMAGHFEYIAKFENKINGTGNLISFSIHQYRS